MQKTMGIGERGIASYSYRGVKRYTTYEPIGVGDWYLVKVLPEEQIYTQAMREAGLNAI